jgi:hypothetical protein
MKRVGQLIEKIAEPDNLRLAFWKAKRGKSRSKALQTFLPDWENEISLLRDEILSGMVSVGKYHYFTIYDPKERRICAADFRERVLHHALARRIADKRSAEEKALIEWEMLIRNKIRASKQSGSSDFLTTAQLAGMQLLEQKLYLNEEEKKFVAESRNIQKKAENKKKSRMVLLISAASFVTIIILVLFVRAFVLKIHADRELAKNIRILDNMDFYAGNYALIEQKDSSGHIRYGFMDRQGGMRIACQYTEAEPFDEYGFARVKLFEKLYLIDTANQRYPLAESPKAITDSTMAISFKEKKMDRIPDEVLKNKQLKMIYLRGNNLKEIPNELKEFAYLNTLDLGYNQFSTVPEVLKSMKGLKKLDLQSNDIAEVDIKSGAFEGIEQLNLSKNKLKKLPEAFKNLKSLKSLDVSGNEIEEMNDVASSLSGAVNLNILGNKINPKARTQKAVSAECKSIIAKQNEKGFVGKPIFLCNTANYEYRIFFAKQSDKVMAQITSTERTALQFNTKISLVSKGEKRSFTFLSNMNPIKINGKEGCFNSIALNSSDLKWLSQHSVDFIYLENKDLKRSLTENSASELLFYVNCLLQM